MRPYKIKSIKAANEFLIDYTLDYNSRFGVQPTSPVSEYQTPVKVLDEVFCIKEYSQVASDHTTSFRGDKFLISERFKYSIQRQAIEIRIFSEKIFETYFGNYKISLIKIDKIKGQAS